MLTRFLLLGLIHAQAQLINMAVCSDAACQSNCIYWSTTANACAPCDKNKGMCNTLNPSSITKSDSLTLYSDSACASKNAITSPMPIVLDNSCRQLVTSGVNVGSYRAMNVSAVIGGVVAGVIVITIIGVTCCCCFCKRRSAMQQPPEQDQPPPPPLHIGTYAVPPPPAYQQQYPSAYPTYNQPTTYVPTATYLPPYNTGPSYTSYPTAQYTSQITYPQQDYGSYPVAPYPSAPYASAPPPAQYAEPQQQAPQKYI